MTDPQALLNLAARAEAAEGPDRELDALIRCTLFAPEGAYIEKSPLNGVWCVWTGEGPTGKRRLFEHWPSQAIRLGEFTASLDAAMQLVPEGWFAVVTNCSGMSEPKPMLEKGGAICGLPDDPINAVTVEAATPALALVAACLKARAQLVEGGGCG